MADTYKVGKAGNGGAFKVDANANSFTIKKAFSIEETPLSVGNFITLGTGDISGSDSASGLITQTGSESTGIPTYEWVLGEKHNYLFTLNSWNAYYRYSAYADIFSFNNGYGNLTEETIFYVDSGSTFSDRGLMKAWQLSNTLYLIAWYYLASHYNGRVYRSYLKLIELSPSYGSIYLGNDMELEYGNNAYYTSTECFNLNGTICRFSGYNYNQDGSGTKTNTCSFQAINRNGRNLSGFGSIFNVQFEGISFKSYFTMKTISPDGKILYLKTYNMASDEDSSWETDVSRYIITWVGENKYVAWNFAVDEEPEIYIDHKTVIVGEKYYTFDASKTNGPVASGGLCPQFPGTQRMYLDEAGNEYLSLYGSDSYALMHYQKTSDNTYYRSNYQISVCSRAGSHAYNYASLLGGTGDMSKSGILYKYSYSKPQTDGTRYVRMYRIPSYNIKYAYPRFMLGSSSSVGNGVAIEPISKSKYGMVLLPKSAK